MLQRKCASCEDYTLNGSECETCSKKRGGMLQRKSADLAGANEAPPIVNEVLNSPGQSLDAGMRAFFEPRFGHDFSSVRVHTDARAAESARSVDALAYTVGRDVVFGTAQYAPSTAEGRRLMAHELTHVTQQDGSGHGAGAGDSRSNFTRLTIGPSDDHYEHEAEQMSLNLNGPAISPPTNLGVQRLQREPMDDSFPPRRRSARPHLHRGGTLPYREATELLACIRIMGESNAAYCRQQVLGEDPSLTGSSPTPAAPTQPPFAQCEPDRTLTWADFTGTPAGTVEAFTGYDYPTATTPSGTRIRAVFDPARSFVRPQFGNPTDPALNGCAANITKCESFFPPGTTGGSFALNSTPSATCPAAIRANPSVVALSLGDCSGIIATECQRVAQAESDRLLRHEQLHFDIACVLAGKANAALASGAALATVQSALTTKDAQLTAQYDTQTSRGCNTAQQATWEANVQAGLTNVTIP
jgi:uncharacterized protein DUF4157